MSKYDNLHNEPVKTTVSRKLIMFVICTVLVLILTICGLASANVGLLIELQLCTN